MERLQTALQALVDEDYDQWGGVHRSLRDAVDAFNEVTDTEHVTIPEDAD